MRVRDHGLPNVRLRQAELDDARLMEEVDVAGGADVVVLLRVLHHAARPVDVLRNAARLLSSNGVVLVVDYAAHDDETMRERGHVWLGFSAERIKGFFAEAGLSASPPAPLTLALPTTAADKHLPFFISVGRKTGSLVH